MNNRIQIFNHEQPDEIRTLQDENGDPWFVGKDVAEVLGYSNTRDALRKHVEEEDKTTVAICDTGSNYKTQATLINESGLYSLILLSKQPVGLFARVISKVTSFTTLQYVNYLLGRPLGHVKYALD